MDEFVRRVGRKKIPVFTEGKDYEASVANSNLLHSYSQPHCVVQPKSTLDVQFVVSQAKTREIPLTIKNGGHSYSGASSAKEGVLLDLTHMNRVDLNMRSRTVTLQGGAKWGHAYRKLLNNREDGYIINGGRCPTVGVSGFILGGGLGPFTRSFGMGCDTLMEATLVTADGEVVTVGERDDKSSDEGKLFWALRGGGGGNFGVVVEMKLRVLQTRTKDVVAGTFTWKPKACSMRAFIATMDRFYTTDWPNEMTIDSSWVCDLGKQKNRREPEPVVRFLVYYNGRKDAFDEAIDESIRSPELANQLKRRSSAQSARHLLQKTLIEQWSDETQKSDPKKNQSYRIYASFVFKNRRKRIAEVTAAIRQGMQDFGKKFADDDDCDPLLQVTWIHGGGKASELSRSKTAFRWRKGVYHTYIMVEFKEDFQKRPMKKFLKKFKKKLRPLSMYGRAAFVNFPDAALSQKKHERAYYGRNRRKLRRVKQAWDPDDFFHCDQGVRLPPQQKSKKSRTRRESPRRSSSLMPSPSDKAMSVLKRSSTEPPSSPFNLSSLMRYIDSEDEGEEDLDSREDSSDYGSEEGLEDESEGSSDDGLEGERDSAEISETESANDFYGDDDSGDEGYFSGGRHRGGRSGSGFSRLKRLEDLGF